MPRTCLLHYPPLLPPHVLGGFDPVLDCKSNEEIQARSN